jgi:AcrR family transcriptional regulator
VTDTKPTPANAKIPVRSRGHRTRSRLLAAAKTVFERKGYLDTRVADIVSAARLAHGSFYTYFDSKEHIFREIFENVVEDVAEALKVPDEGSAAERVTAVVRRQIELYEQYFAILGLLDQVGNLAQFNSLRQRLRRSSVDRAEQLIRGLKEDGETGPEPVDPHIMATALVTMTDSFAHTWLVVREPFDREQTLANLNAIWLRSLGVKNPADRQPGSRTSTPQPRSSRKRPQAS